MHAVFPESAPAETLHCSFDKTDVLVALKDEVLRLGAENKELRRALMRTFDHSSADRVVTFHFGQSISRMFVFKDRNGTTHTFEA